MSDRITPYKEGGSIEERIDEIVMRGADFHFEMMDSGQAFISITDKNGTYHAFWFRAHKSKLILSLSEKISKKEMRK